MDIFALTLQDAFYIVATTYTALLLVLTVAGIIAAMVVKRRVKRKIQALKAVPKQSREYVRTFLHTMFD